jgi:hypothetical protein
VGGEAVQERVGRGVVCLPWVAEQSGNRGEKHEHRQGGVTGKLVQVPGRLDFRSEDRVKAVGGLPFESGVI